MRVTRNDISKIKARGLTVKTVKYLCGIDPGRVTGITIWNRHEREIEAIDSCNIIEAQNILLQFNDRERLLIRLEDATTWKPFRGTTPGPERWQGAGSIKRDCQIWIEFFEYHGFFYELVPLGGRKTKMDAELFRKVTGWTGSTNSHARDSCLLVFGL